MYFLNLKKFKKLNTLKNTLNSFNSFYNNLNTTSNNKVLLSFNTFNISKTSFITNPLLVRGGGAF
ncbi:hypothetical protein B6S12_09360 [Helicobacter valdiviensis]|uniref:Uncharacterized protein n=1 Tax=Helicobacter valdiviensis TaxID=1458358 RepID=A0A2W6NJ59_9HELI|nr:hypothetical protein B6S12_09360 [Helicobacter valdiviensis]